MLGIAVLQGVAVLVALVAFRVSAAAVIPLALLSMVAAVVFSLIAYALRLTAGRAGTTPFVLVLLLQVAALGNVIRSRPRRRRCSASTACCP